MKPLLYLLLFFTLYSCNNEVLITPIEASPSWRGTPGKLVVKKGDLVDTIYDCQFGYTPEYKLLKHLDKEYLFTSCEMNNGYWCNEIMWAAVSIERMVCCVEYIGATK